MSPSRQTLAGFFNPARGTARVAETTSERPSPGKSSDKRSDGVKRIGRRDATRGVAERETGEEDERERGDDDASGGEGREDGDGAPVASVEEAEEAADRTRRVARRKKRSVDASRRRRLSDGEDDEDDEDDVRASEGRRWIPTARRRRMRTISNLEDRLARRREKCREKTKKTKAKKEEASTAGVGDKSVELAERYLAYDPVSAITWTVGQPALVSLPRQCL